MMGDFLVNVFAKVGFFLGTGGVGVRECENFFWGCVFCCVF